MSTSSPAPSGAPSGALSVATIDPSERLATLADLFEAAFLDLDRDEGSPPHLLGVAFDDDIDDDPLDGVDVAVAVNIIKNDEDDEESDGIHLFLKPLDHHPAQELTGWRAPDNWWCLGVASGGWASNYDSQRPPRTTDTLTTNRRRVRLLHLVNRDGEAISVVHQKDHPPIRTRWASAHADNAGMLDDCLRRALGLPSAPPPPDTLECWALLWIDQLLAAAVDGRLARAPWEKAASLHPVFGFLVKGGDRPLRRWALDHLVRAGELLAQAHPWPRLQELTAVGTGPFCGLAPDVVAWMDTGMFARTTLATLPPLEDALLDLFDLLDAEPYARLVDTIDAWGLLHPSRYSNP